MVDMFVKLLLILRIIELKIALFSNTGVLYTVQYILDLVQSFLCGKRFFAIIMIGLFHHREIFIICFFYA